MKSFLKEVNRVDISIRPCKFVERYKMGRLDDNTRMFILTSNFVIPGETLYDCTACGVCCTNDHIKLPVEMVNNDKGCKWLKDSLCSRDDTKPPMCKQFPFKKLGFVRPNGERIKLLAISIHCMGQMMGRVIDEERYQRILEEIDRGPELVGQTRCL